MYKQFETECIHFMANPNNAYLVHAMMEINTPDEAESILINGLINSGDYDVDVAFQLEQIAKDYVLRNCRIHKVFNAVFKESAAENFKSEMLMAFVRHYLSTCMAIVYRKQHNESGAYGKSAYRISDAVTSLLQNGFAFEEVVADCVTYLWKYAKNIESNPAQYFKQSIYHALLDLLRKEHLYVDTTAEDPDGEKVNPSRQVIQQLENEYKVNSQVVRATVEKLPGTFHMLVRKVMLDLIPSDRFILVATVAGISPADYVRHMSFRGILKELSKQLFVDDIPMQVPADKSAEYIYKRREYIKKRFVKVGKETFVHALAC